MNDIFSRTKMIFGDDDFKKIESSHIAVFGVGGVGGYVVEALARTGVLKIDLIDNDVVSTSNINRQIIATTKTVGKYKVDVMRERLLEINPLIEVNTYKTFVTLDNINEFDFSQYDYIVDAIDTVSGKIGLIETAYKNGVKIISSMGAGNKLDPTKFEISDIYKTSVCPLARTMRTELKKRGIEKLKVVYSKEPPIEIPKERLQKTSSNKTVPGSVAYVPSVVGLIIASEVIKDILLKD